MIFFFFLNLIYTSLGGKKLCANLVVKMPCETYVVLFLNFFFRLLESVTWLNKQDRLVVSSS